MDNFSFKFSGHRNQYSAQMNARLTPKNYEASRKPVDPAASRITPALIEWLRNLPPTIRPKNLILKFPRVANTLAFYAGRPVVLDRLLNEYMLDDRGGRSGFPFDVLQEMANLREYYDARTRSE